MAKKYAVKWSGGGNHYGTLPDRFEYEEDAQRFADDWVSEQNLDVLGLTGADVVALRGEGCYSAEVVVAEDKA